MLKERSMNMKSLYFVTLFGLGLSFALVTMWPYLWVFQSFMNFSEQDGMNVPALIVVSAAWLIALSVIVYLRSAAAQCDEYERLHVTLLLHSYVKHLSIGISLLFASLIFVFVPQFEIFGAGEWYTLAWITLSLSCAAYMLAFDWKLLDSIIQSWRAYHSDEPPQSIVSGFHLLKRNFWFAFFPIMAIHFVLFLYGALVLTVLIPAILAVNWLIVIITMYRSRLIIDSESKPQESGLDAQNN